jgi:signal transduction histidine kinase
MKDFKKNIRFTYISFLVLILLSSTISLWTYQRAKKSESWVQHTHLVIQRLQYLISEMKDAEIGVRGFAITRLQSSLLPYLDAELNSRKAFEEIKNLTKDNPQQQESLATLKTQMDAHFKILKGFVNDVNAGKVLSDEQMQSGQRIMNESRHLLENMEEREYALLDKRNHAWKGLNDLVPILVVSTTILSIFGTTHFCRRLQLNYFEKLKLRKVIKQELITTQNRIRIIHAVTSKVAAGDYSVRLNDQENDILGTLSEDINNMIASLEQSFQKLKDWNRNKDDFMNITAHELKTPLTNMKAILQLMARIKYQGEEESKKTSMYVEKANTQVKRLLEIVYDLVEMYRINSGDLSLTYSSFPVAELTQSCLQTFKPDKNKLVVHGQTDLQLQADRAKLEQVLHNLVSNALKYSLDGTDVHISVVQVDGHIRFSVRDEGIGIPPEKLPYVFDRYYRVEQTSQNYSGMGLGLYISKGIIQKHGGQIGVDSEVGKYADFWFTLPLQASATA